MQKVRNIINAWVWWISEVLEILGSSYTDGKVNIKILMSEPDVTGDVFLRSFKHKAFYHKSLSNTNPPRSMTFYGEIRELIHSFHNGLEKIIVSLGNLWEISFPKYGNCMGFFFNYN